MRRFVFPLLFFPTSILANDINLKSSVSSVTLYPAGATVTRTVPYEMPVGEHTLVLTDLPKNTYLESLRVEMTGAKLGAITARDDYVPPRKPQDTAEVKAAKDNIETIETAIRDKQADIEATRLAIKAANAQINFLGKIGDADNIADIDVTRLQDISAMIGAQTLSASEAAHQASLSAQAQEQELKDLQDDLSDAQKELNALVPEQKDRAYVAITAKADAPTSGVVTISYSLDSAAWQPVYDLRLTRDTGDLTIERGASIWQGSGENWTDVDLTLSTVSPSEQVAPNNVVPWKRSIHEKVDLARKQLSSAQYAADESGKGMMTAPVIIEEMVAGADYDGLSVTYTYPAPITLASEADNVRIALGNIKTTAKIDAQAVPMYDETAFLMARLTNDMNEIILPTDEAQFFLDGTYVGRQSIDLIAAGAKADLSFGPIEGIRLKRTILDRQEGDRGVISKSNQMNEDVQIEIENLTGQSWPLQVIDRVPYSEQEDLQISWSAAPKATTTDYDDKRGVLAWDTDIKAGQKQVISLKTRIDWPAGMILR